MRRTYITRVIGDGLTLETGFRSVIFDLFPFEEVPEQLGLFINSSNDPYWFGTLEASGVQHAVMARSSLVREIEFGPIFENRAIVPRLGLTALLILLGEAILDERGVAWESPP